MAMDRRERAKLCRRQSAEIATDLAATYDEPSAMTIATFALAMLARHYYRDGPAFAYFIDNELPKMLHGSPVETAAIFEVPPAANRLRDAEATIEWIATALPVLRTMCEVAGLKCGAAKAQEMIDHLRERHGRV